MNDHSGQGHDMPMSGGSGPMCSMNMLWNHDVENVCVVFSSWHIRGPFSMFISCLIIIFIAILYASLNTYIRTYDKRLAYSLSFDSRKSGTHSPGEQPTARGGLIPPIPPGYGVIESSSSARNGPTRLATQVRVVRAGLYAASVAISFWLMLVAMTYNTYLFSSIIVGAFIGHMLYEPEIDVGAALGAGAGKGLACH